MGVTNIIGIEKADRMLAELGIRQQISVIRSGLRKAVKPTIAAARANAPRRTGKLKKSIGSVNSRDAQGMPGITTGARRKIAPHANLIEFGTSGVVRKHKKNPKTKRKYEIGTRYRNPTPPNSFMRRAVKATENQVRAIVGAEIGKALYKKMSRA